MYILLRTGRYEFFSLLVWSGPVSVRNLEIFYFFTLVSSFLYPEMGKISKIIAFLKCDHLIARKHLCGPHIWLAKYRTQKQSGKGIWIRVGFEPRGKGENAFQHLWHMAYPEGEDGVFCTYFFILSLFFCWLRNEGGTIRNKRGIERPKGP